MFHINLKNRRLTCGLSQKQIADYLNITPQSVSKWENGDALPSIDYLPKLAECLNCDINAFFAPIEKISIDANALCEFMALVLRSDDICNTSEIVEEVIAFESKYPSSIVSAIYFCEELRKQKTVDLKALQKILDCSEAEARLFMEQLTVGELVERLDIEDTYLVFKDTVRWLIVLLSCYQVHQEQLCNPQFDFKASLYEKIDAIKRNDE